MNKLNKIKAKSPIKFNKSSDVIVVGGGIAGLMTAFYLLEAGKSVCLIERDKVGQGASWAGGGILSPLRPWRYSEWHQRLTVYSLECLEAITHKLAAVSCEFEKNNSGMVYINEPLERTLENWLLNNSSAELLQGSQLAAKVREWSLCDAWSKTILSAVWMPAVANIRNPRFLKALKTYLLLHTDFQLLEQVNVQLVVGCMPGTKQERVLGLNLRVTGNESASEFMPSSQVVITAGAWSTQLFKGEGPKIKPIKGEMLLFKPQQKLPTIVMEGEHYLIPRSDGLVLAGSTTENAGYDLSTTLDAKELLHKFAARIMPELEILEPLRHWVGLRPAVEGMEGEPYIGLVNGLEGVWVNSGHYRNGIVHGPGSAKLLVDTMLGEQPYMPLSLKTQLSRRCQVSLNDTAEIGS